MALRFEEELVERAAQDREAAIMGLKGAAEFESNNLITILKCRKNHLIFEENKQEIWMEAVKSNNKATV